MRQIRSNVNVALEDTAPVTSRCTSKANNEQTGIRAQPVSTTGQYSTLGHAGSINSSLKHLVTRDSGCQTDDIKIVPPSMRRIRSQKGQGITTQMANMSLSSSGSISNMSDCNGAICTRPLNASDQGFHSLPRQGARICLQKLEPSCSSSPYLMISGSTSSLPYQVTMQHASPDSQLMSDLRKNTSISSGSDEFHGFQNECQKATSDSMGSIHNSSTSSLNTLQNARNFSSVHSSQSFDTKEAPLHSMSTCPSDQPFSSSGTSCSASSSCCQSPASFHMATETKSQCSTLDGRNCSPSAVYEDSDMSESSIHSCSTLTTDHWMYKLAPMDQCTSSCSSPINNACNSLEYSPKKTDTSSLFSVDTEGCNSSMHLASDCKSYSHGCINKARNTRHKFYECREHHSNEDRASLHSNHSLTRSISLRKAKKPPLPPKRTDSLQRKPQQKPYHNDKLLNEQLISSLHESLKSHSASFSSQMPFSGLEDPWVLGPRSQSTVSVASSGMSAPAAMCPITPTHSDSSSQHSEYTESWDFDMNFPHSCTEHVPSSQITRPVLIKENSRGSDSNGIPLTACNKTGINSKMAASPDKIQLMTSPSSGYSSQSITPTTGTPVISLLRAKSPAGRPKPKVPERKSSLRSSVSSYSTPLSSNTSDSVKSLPMPPPLPKTLPGLVSLQSSSTSPMPSFVMSNISPITPVPSLLAISSTPEKKQNSPPVSSPIPEECKTSIHLSPDSPPPTSEVSSPLMLNENKMSPLPLPPPPPLLSLSVHTQPLTPPFPGTGLNQAVAILKASKSTISLDTMENRKELNSRQSDKPARHERPVITAQALQRVQLRPVKLMKLENIFTDIITTVCGPENQENNKEPRTSTDKTVETETVKNVLTPDSVNPHFPSKESIPTTLVSNPPSVLLEPASNTHSGKSILELSLDIGPVITTPGSSNVLHSTATPCTSNGILQDQLTLISPKKSNHSLNMPPIVHQPALNGLEHLEVTDSAMSFEPETQNSTSLADTVNPHEIPLQLEFEFESDSQNSTPVSPRRHSLSSEISSDSLTDPQLTGLSLSDQDIGLCDTDLGLCDKDLVLSDDKCITDDSLSSSSGSVIFKEEENDENDAVFDSGTDSSSPTFSSTGEDTEELQMPARPRTTDDLFAAIHRSKRKVLGRCESEEERSRGFITTPPTTPTSSSPSMTWMPRQSSHIHRRLRHSTTSNDSFKALLLKKGSRSEPGFRMSAMEMLKCTDPRLQRSNAEASSPFSAQCTSPGRSRRASEEWARTEGVLPRFSPSLTHSKYGRSSTPPCAASSRYNSRSRIPSGPMTVICEKEGELTESSDCCNIPFPVSLSSSGTVCAQGST